MQILLQEATSENAVELHESIIKFNKNPYLFIENYRQGFNTNDIAHYILNKKNNGMQYCIRDEIDSRLLGFINMPNIDYKSRKAKIYLTAFSVKECIIAMAQVIDILKRYKNVSKLHTQLLSSEGDEAKVFNANEFNIEGKLNNWVFINNRYHDVLYLGTNRN